MSRKGNPWDNASCESFMKTLKYEEVHRRNTAIGRTRVLRIGHFLEQVYNAKAAAFGARLSVHRSSSSAGGFHRRNNMAHAFS